MTELMNYLTGILLTLLATVMFNISPVLQRDAVGQMKEIKLNNTWSSIKAMLSNKKWLAGMIVGTIGGIPYAVAISLAGITVVQPLINFGFLVLVYAAHKYLHEPIDKKTITSIIILIIMPLFIALGNVSQPTADINQAGNQLWLAIFVIFSIVLVFILTGFSRKYPIVWTAITGILFALGATFLQATMSIITFSGYNLVNNPGAILANLFQDPYLRLMILTTLLCLVFNVVAGYVMQIGLQKISASKFYPIDQTINNLVAIVGGIIVFGQRINTLPLYLIGVVMAIVGSILLGQYQVKPM